MIVLELLVAWCTVAVVVAVLFGTLVRAADERARRDLGTRPARRVYLGSPVAAPVAVAPRREPVFQHQ